MKKFLGVIFISFLLCTNIYANPKESIKKDSLIISGVNFEDPQQAARVAKEMFVSGANAILIFPPFSWSQGVSTKMIYDHHKIISESVQGPIFLYQSSVNSGHLSYKKD